MSRPPEELISVREYARIMECSEAHVRRAIDRGHLGKGVVAISSKGGRSVNKILPSIATKSWSSNFSSTNVQNPKLAEKLGVVQTSSDGSGGIDDGIARNKRAQGTLRTGLMKLEYDERSGALVSKQLVYEAYFAAGIMLRDSILSVPDKLIDDIRAAETRHEAHQILYNGLAESLEELANTPTITQ